MVVECPEIEFALRRFVPRLRRHCKYFPRLVKDPGKFAQVSSERWERKESKPARGIDTRTEADEIPFAFLYRPFYLFELKVAGWVAGRVRRDTTRRICQTSRAFEGR